MGLYTYLSIFKGSLQTSHFGVAAHHLKHCHLPLDIINVQLALRAQGEGLGGEGKNEWGSRLSMSRRAVMHVPRAAAWSSPASMSHRIEHSK